MNLLIGGAYVLLFIIVFSWLYYKTGKY